MTIETSITDSVLNIVLSGRLDTLSSPELENKITLLNPSIHEITVDCKSLDYISSAGLRVLLMFRKKLGSDGKMKVTGAISS